jgi:hypothetical protein
MRPISSAMMYERLLCWVDTTGLTALISDNIGVGALLAKPANGKQLASSPLHELWRFKAGSDLASSGIVPSSLIG